MTTSIQRLKSSAAAIGVAALLAVSVGQAEAALMNCPGSFITDGSARVHDGDANPANFSAAGACQYISEPDASRIANLATVNAERFFGFDDWAALDAAQTQVSVGDVTSGAWSIPGADFGLYDYAIFFKSGNATNIVGFLLDGAFGEGRWETPFTKELFTLPGAGRPRDISHYSIFQRSSGPPRDTFERLPEPGVLGLLGLGLLGLGLAARKRRRRGA